MTPDKRAFFHFPFLVAGVLLAGPVVALSTNTPANLEVFFEWSLGFDLPEKSRDLDFEYFEELAGYLLKGAMGVFGVIAVVGFTGMIALSPYYFVISYIGPKIDDDTDLLVFYAVVFFLFYLLPLGTIVIASFNAADSLTFKISGTFLGLASMWVNFDYEQARDEL